MVAGRSVDRAGGRRHGRLVFDRRRARRGARRADHCHRRSSRRGRFSFRWGHEARGRARTEQLATGDLRPRARRAGGTRVRMTETGFRETRLGGRRSGGSTTRSTSRVGTTSSPASVSTSHGWCRRHDGQRRRRALVGDRGPHAASDARPAPDRWRGNGHQPQRAPASDASGGREASRRARPRRPGPRHTRRTGDALPRRRRTARPRGGPAGRGGDDLGRHGCGASGGSPRRSSARKTRPTTTRRRR